MARAAAALLGLAVAAPAGGAQPRVVERHGFDSSEGRLLGFYSALLTYTPIASDAALPAGGARLGLEVSYVPYLDAERRSAGFDKPEGTNLAPLFPRPRLAVGLPAGFVLEGSWTPPVRVFGVRAHLASLALARELYEARGVRLAGRIAASGGRVRGAISCSEELARSTASDDRTYYASVCHGRTSDDWLEPRHLLVELLASPTRTFGPLRVQIGAGARVDRTRFDLGVVRGDGTRDPDHPILELHGTRGYGMAGAAWRAGGRGELAGELFWAPGSLATARVRAGMLLGGRGRARAR